MLKKGICEWRDLQAAQWSSADRPISYRLLRLPAPDEEAVRAFETIARGICHSSGVCRTTSRGRLRDIDRLAEPYLATLATTRRPLEVHDWAASDGLASSEWARDLLDGFPCCHFTASDLNPYLVEVSFRGQGTYIFERDGAPLQYVRPPFVISLKTTNARGVLADRLVRAWARRAAGVWASLPKSDAGQEAADDLEHADVSRTVRRLSLIHPETLALQRQNPRFKVLPHSVFSPLAAPVDVIRTMNIFHHSYFGDRELEQGASAVFHSLRPGGLWIVGRTTVETVPMRNQTSLFRRLDGEFLPLHRLHGGWDREEILRRLGWLQ